MATLEDLRFISCAYFYKLKDGISITNKDIENMLIESMSGKKKPFLFNITRQNGPDTIRYSLRVFKDYPKTPSFLINDEPNWREQKIGYILVIEYESYIAMLRKYANVPKWFMDKMQGIDYNVLLSLCTDNATEFKKMSMQNLDGSDHAMRYKSFEAVDLKENISPIGSSRYYVRSLRGNNGNDKFALTLYSSRINKFKPDMTIGDICSWVKNVVDQMLVATSPSTFLKIFAKPEKYADVYKSLTPSSLLVQNGLISYLHDECDTKFYHVKNGIRSQIGESLFNKYMQRVLKTYEQVDNIAEPNGTNRYYTGTNHQIEIVLNKSGIKLKNELWSSIEIEESPSGLYDGTLAELINRNSLFNVYFTDTELVYNNKVLFRDTKLMGCIPHYLSILEDSINNPIDCEKHQQQNTNRLAAWGVNSMFAYIEQTQTQNYTYMICDDCNDEWADHIGINQDVVTFFVEKHKSNVSDSASDFQEVVGQAQKNLANLSPSADQLNNKKQLWQGLYLHSSIQRFRSATGNVSDAIIMWNNNVLSPKFRREMCLVVDFLSKSSFEQQIHNIEVGQAVVHEASVRQRLWLISSFVNSCLEYGVIPRIICRP